MKKKKEQPKEKRSRNIIKKMRLAKHKCQCGSIRFKTVKKGSEYQCRKCGEIKRGVK